MNYQQSKLDHESFLAKKKAEILAKKNAQKNPASTIIQPSEKPDKSTTPTPKVPFANDGSFLEKFMAMQNAKSSLKPSPVSNQVSSSSKVNVKIEKGMLLYQSANFLDSRFFLAIGPQILLKGSKSSSVWLSSVLHISQKLLISFFRKFLLSWKQVQKLNFVKKHLF